MKASSFSIPHPGLLVRAPLPPESWLRKGRDPAIQEEGGSRKSCQGGAISFPFLLFLLFSFCFLPSPSRLTHPIELGGVQVSQQIPGYPVPHTPPSTVHIQAHTSLDLMFLLSCCEPPSVPPPPLLPGPSPSRPGVSCVRFPLLVPHSRLISTLCPCHLRAPEGPRRAAPPVFFIMSLSHYLQDKLCLLALVQSSKNVLLFSRTWGKEERARGCNSSHQMARCWDACTTVFISLTSGLSSPKLAVD